MPGDMNNHDDPRELLRDIRSAMDYAVPEDRRAAADDLVDEYRDDRLALTLLREFYSFLPEAADDWARDILLIDRKRGIFLLALQTGAKRYVYLASDEGIEFHGEASAGFLADELLDFFGYENMAAFVEKAAGALPAYEPLNRDPDICPVCHAASGECHELGCVVEICPWCGGQLVHCGCRHEQLGVDSIDTEAQILQFEAILEERGRIPYSPEQRPGYLGEEAEWEE